MRKDPPQVGSTLRFNRRQFLKSSGYGAAGVLLLMSAPQCLAARRIGPGKLPRSLPEAQGVKSAGILAFLEAVGASKHEFHSFMMLRHGHVIAEGWWRPYRPAAPHMLYSLSKSFTSTAVGLAVGEGRLKATDKVISFFPDDLPSTISDNLARLQVNHLLMMGVGHGQDSTGALWGDQNWVRKFLSLPIPNEPGTAFLYNSGATYMCSAIVQKLTGQTLLEYLGSRLFKPLGIEEATWEVCPRGINTGGWGLKLRTEALAKFGQLYLQKGSWDGKQLLPAAWVEEATTSKIQQPSPELEKAKLRSDWHQGYCYQFWRCRHNAFRGDGAFGQYTIVMPEQEAVIAITSESPNMQGQLDLVYEHLSPAIGSGPLPADKAAQRRLGESLEVLALAPLAPAAAPAIAARISGRTYTVASNALGIGSLSFRFDKHSGTFSVRDGNGEHAVKCGFGRWVDGETTMPGTPPKLTQGPLGPKSKVAASAAWKDEHTLEMMWRFYETPHHDSVTCRFEGEGVKVEFLNSLTKMSPARKETRPVLEAR
jgi:CubicO group peptidase (beta-lactamase class C family)